MFDNLDSSMMMVGDSSSRKRTRSDCDYDYDYDNDIQVERMIDLVLTSSSESFTSFTTKMRL